jgi:AraC-like DNA-binding protein
MFFCPICVFHQLRIRAFIDHQPGNIIPIENVQNISVTETRNEVEASRAKLARVISHLLKSRSDFSERERIFRSERAAKEKEIIEAKEEFFASNRSVLDGLHLDAAAQDLSDGIKDLIDDVNFSHSEYRALLNAKTDADMYAHERSVQVCRYSDSTDDESEMAVCVRLVGVFACVWACGSESMD